MDRSKALSRIDEVAAKGRSFGLNSVIVVYISPLINEYDCRVGYFQEYAQAYIFAENIKERYDRLNFSYSVYVNGWKTFGGKE